jgi:hypothetical protein
VQTPFYFSPVAAHVVAAPRVLVPLRLLAASRISGSKGILGGHGNPRGSMGIQGKQGNPRGSMGIPGEHGNPGGAWECRGSKGNPGRAWESRGSEGILGEHGNRNPLGRKGSHVLGLQRRNLQEATHRLLLQGPLNFHQ